MALLAVMFVTSQPRDVLTSGERLVRDALAPVETALSSATHWLGNVAARYRSWRSLQEENEALRQQVTALQARNQALEEAWRENRLLRAMLGLVEESERPLVPATVIGRPVSNWWSQLTINRGEGDGLTSRLPVITPEGAVGWVLSVSERTAEVLLLVDPRSAVGAMVRRTGDPVVVEGVAAGPTRLRLRALVADADLQPGDWVITSDFSQIFPSGLLIGRIVEVAPTPSGRAAEAWLEPAVDFSRLEMVAVLLEPQE